jgi:penicillin-binding protein 2
MVHLRPVTRELADAMYWPRLRIFLVLVVLVMLLLTGRLIQLQLSRAEVYRRVADNNLIRPTVFLETRRGTIRDRSRRVLAEDVPRFDLCVYYPFIAAPDEAFVARKAAREGRPVADVRREMRRYWLDAAGLRRFKARIGRKEVEDAQLLRDLSALWSGLADRAGVGAEQLDATREATLRRVTSRGERVRRVQGRDLRIREEAFGTTGSIPHAILEDIGTRAKVFVAEQQTAWPFLVVRQRAERRYRHGGMAAHVLGYTGGVTETQVGCLPGGAEPVNVADELRAYHLNDACGKDGIERTFERQLRGTMGLERRRRDGAVLERVEAQPGQDIHLTLDAPFQSEVEGFLSRPPNLPAGYGRPRGAAVVIDVRTGDILALASAPTYDLNSLAADLADLLQPGAGKPMLHRAVAGRYSLGSIYKIIAATAALHEGTITEETVLHCAHYLDPAHPERFRCLGRHGDIRLQRAFRKSCNVYFYQVALMLGRPKMVAWGRKFGLGRPVGLLVPGEAAGNLPDKIDPRNLVIGQGELLVTPLQMARVAALVATGGRMTEVHLVRSPRPADRPLRQVDMGLREDLVDRVRRGMTDVVNDPEGTGYKTVRSDRIRIAGKTGSAQAGRGQPTNSWFIGYAPAENPQIAFAVVFERAGHGGTVAGPVARQIVEAALTQKLITAD